jgi:hypothetical protein
VVGTPRAGTTLVSRILDRHPAVFGVGETHFFEDLWANRKTLGDLKSQAELETAVARLMTVFGRFNQLEGQSVVDRLVTPNTLVKKALAYGGGYDGLFRAFSHCLDETEGQRRYCDDTPRHLFYLKTIFRFFPEAAVIICVRDPRDFLCSYKNFWRSSRDPDRIKALFHPIVTSLLWRSSANVVLNEPLVQQSEKIMWLRYESLVTEPEKMVSEMCQFAGLEYDGRLLAIESHNSSFDQSQSNGIFQGSVGQWTTCLNPEDLWWAQRINRHQMQRLGYETAELKISPVKLMAVLLSTPLALLRALRANSGRRGPLVPYLLRRLTLLRK